MSDTTGPQTFLTGLWRIAEQRGLSDAALARLLGVGHPYLSRVKSGARGKRGPSLRFTLLVLREFPELAPLLSPDLQIGDTEVPKCNEEVA